MFESANWLLTNKAVRCRYVGDLYHEDVLTAAEAIIQLFDASPATFVHVVYDLVDMHQMKTDLKEMIRHPMAQKFHTHPKLGWSIYVGDTSNSFHSFVTSVLNQQHDAKMRWFKTTDEAVSFLASADDEIALQAAPENTELQG